MGLLTTLDEKDGGGAGRRVKVCGLGAGLLMTRGARGLVNDGCLKDGSRNPPKGLNLNCALTTTIVAKVQRVKYFIILLYSINK